MPVTTPEKPTYKPSHLKLSLLKRLGWFVLLYACGVGAVGIVAYGIKLWIKS
jgi:hypothetical protein